MRPTILSNRTLLIVSYWGYPFGGGEEYLFQTGIWANLLGMHVYWISFANHTNQMYDQLNITKRNGIYIIQIPGGFNEKSLLSWVKLINPDLIHHQGHFRKAFYDVVSKTRIPFMTGIHFWNGIIKLHPEYGNVDILLHAEHHQIDPEFTELIESENCIFYSVSRFVSQVIDKITRHSVQYVAYPCSINDKYFIPHFDPIKNKYVTVINIHKLKGGKIVLDLLQKMYDIPFIVVQTEMGSEKLDKLIQETIAHRNIEFGDSSQYLERVSDPKQIIAQTKIFLAPSLCDETFCRTVNEFMMNSIPVITTGQGNIKYLVEGAGIVIPKESPLEMWVSRIKEIYFDNDLFLDISKKTRTKYLDYSEAIGQTMFVDMVHDILVKSKENNVMILTPWCDQGLGIQSRNYYNILQQHDYNVFIFSYKPYNANSALELQKNPDEWLIDNIYYSPNDREHIKDIELLTFIKSNNIGKCIIPETCWFRIFEIAKLMRQHDVKCYAIPNIEIVRRDEIAKHNYFYKILCNNHLCQTIFNDHMITKTQYVGYGILDPDLFKPSIKKDCSDTALKFLFIGGMNAFSRKNILLICEGFSIVAEKYTNIQLTCTIQKINSLELTEKEQITKYLSHPRIKFVQEHLKYTDIIDLYNSHHISIQVSKHEGLGLGFYEALATGTPILTLDTPPHNEIVIENVNGWVIPCYYEKMKDNNDSFVKSAFFKPITLANKIEEIILFKDDLEQLSENLITDYTNRLSPDIFSRTFIESF